MNPTDLRIFIDLDGVVADWVGQAVQTFGLNIDTDWIADTLGNDARGIEQIIRSDHLWDVIDSQGEEWWDTINPFPWAMYLYKEATKIGDVCFLTQPSDHGSSAAGKNAWIRRIFNTKSFLMGAPKHMCASRYAILIDDTPKKVSQFDKAGGKGILFPNSFKMLREATGMKPIWVGSDLGGYIAPNCLDEVNKVLAACRQYKKSLTVEQKVQADPA